jgi:hypothetical protein
MVLCDTERVEFFQLDDVGRIIWRECQEQATVDGLARRLAESYPDETLDRLRKEVRRFLSSLKRAGLVREYD